MSNIIYFNPKNSMAYVVMNNYCHSLQCIKNALIWASEQGLTVPEDEKINIEIFAGMRHKRMMSIEFLSVTFPKCDFINLEEYPQYYEYLVY
jgi:hypothetical protein